MQPSNALKLIAELKKANAGLITTADDASARYVLAIQKSQARLLAKMSELIAESPDLSSLPVKARLKWYMDNAVSSAKTLRATGYSKAANDYLASLSEIAKAASLASRAAAPAFTDVPEEFVKFMQQRSYEHLDFLGTEAIKKIDTTLLEMSVGGYSRGGMLEELKGVIMGEYPWGNKAGLYEWHAGTYVRTAAQRQAQLFMNYQAEKYGLEKFMYSGPLDDSTREFCLKLLRGGRFYTKAEIEGMDNGQTVDVFTTCGGFNCRHKWVAVSNEIASAIEKESNTDGLTGSPEMPGTIEDLQNYYKDNLGIELTSVSRLPSEQELIALQRTASELGIVQGKYSGMPVNGVKLQSFGSKTLADWNYQTQEMRINRTFISKYGSFEDYEKHLNSLYESGWHSAPGFKGVIDHEYGHAIAHKMGGAYAARWEGISGYARKKGSEGWAEGFSRYESGIPFNDAAKVEILSGKFHGIYTGNNEIRGLIEKMLGLAKGT